eukprot:947561-Lingulodinium_polyedra.AAC.1
MFKDAGSVIKDRSAFGALGAIWCRVLCRHYPAIEGTNYIDKKWMNPVRARIDLLKACFRWYYLHPPGRQSA